MRNVNTPILIAAASTAVAVIVGVLFYKRSKRNNPPTEWKPVGKVTKLHLYPLKSGRRIELTSAEITKYGIRQNKDEEKALQLRDRSFIVYAEESNEFKTARTFPKMVLIEVSVHDESHVAFDAPGMRSLYVKLPNVETTEGKFVKVHDQEEIFTLDCGDEAASWISRYIYGKPSGVRIGYHDALSEHNRSLTTYHKKLTDFYENLGDQSGGLYSDLTSFLLINQASVDDLNSRISNDTTVTSENFRPIITIGGEDAPAYSEDNWDWIKIGDAVFRNVKPCTRCVMTTVNPETGVRNDDREPLKTLEKYRKLKDIKNIDLEGKSPVMGIHLEVNTSGIVKLKDTIYIG